MTLIATPGDTANSYAEVAFADEYIGTHDPEGKWGALDTSVKEGHLQRATEMLDPLKWKGGKSDTSNSLRWPRQYVYDKDDVLLDAATIPAFLKRATCELAFHLSEGDTTREAGFRRVELGPLRLESGDEELADQDPIPAQVRRMIHFYLEPYGATLVRG